MTQRKETFSPDSERRLAPLARLFLAAAAAAAYGGTFGAPFLLDDDASIPGNPTIRHLAHLGRIFHPPPEATVGGRPLLNLSLALNYAVSGLSVWSYHALNLLIHIGAGLVLFGIVRRTLERRKTADAVLVAFAAALFWTLHPLQTEAVTYVVQRAESLMGLFYLLTLYCFIRGARLCPPDAGSAAAVEPNLWFGLSWLACLLGMAAKEVMVTAPVMVFLYDRTFVAGSFREAWAKRKGTYLGLAATWILLGVLVASTGGNRGGAAGFGVGVKPWAYWLTQFEAVGRYLRLSVWPHPLIFEYGTFWVRGAGEVLPSAAVVLPLVGATIWALVRRPALGFLGAWFFGILALTSAVPGTTQMIVEHRMYLSLAAVAVLAALGLARLAGALGDRWRGTAMLGLTLALGAALGAATYGRNRDYRSELVLWQDTVAKRPDNALAQSYLGLAWMRLGRLPEAIDRFKEALRLDPSFADARDNLGQALAESGRLAEAADAYRTLLRLAPEDAAAHDNFGLVLCRLGRPDEAVAQYEAALRLRPDYPEAHGNLALVLARLGRWPEAAEQYGIVLSFWPESAEVRFGYGNALLHLGRPDEAIGQYEAALRLRPESAMIRNNWGNALLAEGRIEEARAQYEAALRLQPGLAAAQRNLARLPPR